MLPAIKDAYDRARREKRYEVRVIFFEGISVVSKLIKWFTRSRFSHVGFDLGDGVHLVEAWEDTRNKLLGIFGAKWQLTTYKYHTPGTPYIILTKKVDVPTLSHYYYILDFIAQAKIPYDWKEILGFIFKWKEKESDGRFICSTGTCFILQWLGILPKELPYWRMSPQDVFEVCIANGFEIAKTGVVK